MDAVCRVLTLLAVLTASLLPQAVRAAERPIGVGPVQYDGEFPGYFRREIEQTIFASIEQVDGEVIDLRGHECEQLACLRTAAKRSNAAIVVLALARAADRDYRIELVAYRVAGGRELARSVVECRVCGQREVLDAIPGKIVALHADVAATLAAPPEPHVSARALQIGGAVTLSLGLVGVGTGTVLWALDGRDYGPSCAPGRIDGNGACPEVYTTGIAGYIGVGLGVVALAIGTGLLIHQRRGHAGSRVRVMATGLELRF